MMTQTYNSNGQILYGVHMYPGVAEYHEAGREPYRVFLNEDTIRSMDPTFAGRPVFVMHVDGVDENIDAVRKEADGWVVESFYNQADGKHWAKFIVVSERGLRAIDQGMRLSNCYVPRGFGQGGLWNGVQYAKEVTGAEYEHLAIVPNPRYEESVIMNPEEFKKYNEDKLVELKRLANSTKEPGRMKLNFFKRTKVENAPDLEGISVQLPKSGREVTVMQLVNEADEADERKKLPQVANSEHLVDVGGSKMTLNELLDKHKAVCDELEGMKKKHADDDPDDSDDGMQNDEEDKKKEDDEAKQNAADDAAEAKRAADAAKQAAKDKAERLRNANSNQSAEPVVRIDTARDQVQRGKDRYGSRSA